MSDCNSANTPPPARTPKPTTAATPTPRPQATSATTALRSFINTWDNIHLLQVFDYHIHNPAEVAPYYDFIWGASPNQVNAFRAGNPNIILSYYIAFFRDSGSFANDDTHQSLAYWKQAHPDWILYQCDKVTPAYFDEQYNVVPFDFTNPEFINWQLQSYALPASQNGYDAIAADNLNLNNDAGACGHYDKQGNWVQRYSGERNDPQWRQDVLTWVSAMQKGLHALAHPLALVPNLGLETASLSDPVVQQIVAHMDAVLDESSFTNYGKSYVTDERWLQMIDFINHVQTQQKAYYLVNESRSITSAQTLWILASYLMCKQHSASLFISGAQQYGYDLRDQFNEYNARVGSPRNDMYKAQGVYWRDYTHATVVVNPSSTDAHTVTLSGQFNDVYGQAVSGTLTLPPHSGQILLF